MPLFFFSYAQADAEKNPFVKKFHDHLREAVRGLAGEAGREHFVSFKDLSSIEPGKPWTDSITEALRTCKVFVYLHSQTYFGREGCGKEYRVIRDRLERAEGHSDLKGAAAIQPVFWNETHNLHSSVPPEVLELQYKHEDYGEAYNANGMVRVSRFDNSDYWQVVDALSRRIIDAARNSPLPPLDKRPDWHALEPLFPTQAPSCGADPTRSTPPRGGPTHARFIWIVGKPDELRDLRDVSSYDLDGRPEEWRMFAPERKDPGRIIAGKAALELNLTYQSDVDPTNGDELLEAVQKANEANMPVVVVVDLWTLHIEQYHTIVRTFEASHSPTCAIVFPWNDADPETSRSKAQLRTKQEEVLPLRFHRKDPDFMFSGVTNSKIFEKMVIERLAYYKDILRKARKAPPPVPSGTGPLSTPTIPTSSG